MRHLRKIDRDALYTSIYAHFKNKQLVLKCAIFDDIIFCRVNNVRYASSSRLSGKLSVSFQKHFVAKLQAILIRSLSNWNCQFLLHAAYFIVFSKFLKQNIFSCSCHCFYMISSQTNYRILLVIFMYLMRKIGWWWNDHLMHCHSQLC